MAGVLLNHDIEKGYLPMKNTRAPEAHSHITRLDLFCVHDQPNRPPLRIQSEVQVTGLASASPSACRSAEGRRAARASPARRGGRVDRDVRERARHENGVGAVCVRDEIWLAPHAAKKQLCTRFLRKVSSVKNVYVLRTRGARFSIPLRPSLTTARPRWRRS